MERAPIHCIVIINPKSGNRKASLLVKTLEKNYPDVPYIIPESREDFLSSLERLSDKYETILLVGGDGTINHALPYFIRHPEKKLAIFPAGSGNGFAMETGFSNDLEETLADIRKGESVFLDVVKINQHYSCNVAGLGMDGYIANLFLDQQKRGFLKYIGLTIRALFSFSSFPATITVEDKTYTGEFMSIIFANTRQFGNKAYIAPKANPGDGKMNLVLVKKMSLGSMISFFIRLFIGDVEKHAQVQMLETNMPIEVSSNFTFAHVDGEPFVAEETLRVEVLPKAIQIIKTKKQSFKS